MSGHWFWNFSFGLLGFLLYFLLSIEKKEPAELIIHSFLVFILLFFVMYLIRYLVSIGIQTQEELNEEKQIDSENELLTLTKQLEKEDVAKVVSYIRNQIQKDRNG
ncbi:hypothetical protein [Bacillus litorisediminis]|uniref:hypothetical protein n=1 Tax=Bacillus litorisediminis TaxID=2922713 RepID=UPI001FAF6CD9|nr:hypothetical protein [Bacillus litorisediminis]